MPNTLRIPTWLLGLTIVVIPAAFLRVLITMGVPGATAFLYKVVAPIAIFGYGAIVIERSQTQGRLSPSPWLNANFSRRIFLTILILSDIGCALAVLLGGPFIPGYGI